MEKPTDINEFEEVFASMWKTAKARRITKKDIENEIKIIRSKP